ncbi:MAG TPA: DinB family protein, partial [Blastocatellia bacterium]|nr:DinB family protein [Blastocatellia bacterium]
MSNAAVARPEPTEYAPYHEKYISKVQDGNIVATLEEQGNATLTLLRGITEADATRRYAPDMWSIKEVVGHIIDCERIFAYRALRFARNDPTPQPGFDQDEYVRNGSFDKIALADLANEFE